MAKWVKDLALSLLWHKFDPDPRIYACWRQGQKQKQKQNKQTKKKQTREGNLFYISFCGEDDC